MDTESVTMAQPEAGTQQHKTFDEIQAELAAAKRLRSLARKKRRARRRRIREAGIILVSSGFFLTIFFFVVQMYDKAAMSNAGHISIAAKKKPGKTFGAPITLN